MKITQKKLSNNLRVLIINKPHLPTVTLAFLAKAGSVDESRGKNGTCTLAHRMNLRGTKSLPDTFKLNLKIEKFGASIVSGSDKEVTSLQATCERKFLPQISKLFADIIKNPLDRKTDLEKEKQILASQIKELEDDPKNFASLIFGKQIFKGSKLANLALGNIRHLPNITISDIRKFRQNYFQQDTILAICGDFSEEFREQDVSNLFERQFNFKLGKKKKIAKRFKSPKKYYEVKFKDIQQPVFILGTFAPIYRSKDFYKYSLLRILLGAGFGGKAMKIIREKLHLAYYAYSFYSPTNLIGTGGIMAGVFAQKLDLAIKEARKILKHVKLITKKELQRAKGYYQGILTTYNESSSQICSFYAGQLARQGKIKTIEEIIEEIESFNLKEIKSICKKYFKQKLYLTLISPTNLRKKI